MTLHVETCIFCKIIIGRIPCIKITETSKLLAFMDINPLANGHVLIIPKYHGERLHDIPEEYLSEMLPLARRIAIAAFDCDYNLLQNNGRLAHQEVDHVHLHLIPKRNQNEGLGIGWPSTLTDNVFLERTAREIRSKLND